MNKVAKASTQQQTKGSGVWHDARMEADGVNELGEKLRH